MTLWYVQWKICWSWSRSNMLGSRKFCQRGGQLWSVFLFCFGLMRGSKYHYKQAIIHPPGKRHLNGFSLRQADDGPTIGQILNAGLVALWIFRRSRPVFAKTPCPPFGSAHVQSVWKAYQQTTRVATSGEVLNLFIRTRVNPQFSPLPHRCLLTLLQTE